MIYLAGSCDTENRSMMVSIAKYLRQNNVEVYCPWELKIENAWDYSQEDWAKLVFEADISAINKAEAVIMISVGRHSTAGTNWEQGYAYAKNIPVHVIQVTDATTSLMTYWGCNSFITHDKNYGPIKSELNWILDHIREENHTKCRTVLT